MASEEVISQPGGDSTYPGPSGPSQDADRTKDSFEPSEDEKKVVASWQQRVERAEKNESRKQWVDELPTWRGYVDGTKHGDKSGERLVRTNMVFATIAAQMPELYAKNPTIAVTPTDAAPKDRLEAVKDFCKTAESVIRTMLVEEPKLKKRAKANLRSACTTAYGALKLLFQKDLMGDPIAVRRMEDTQDNLARVEALAKEIKKGDDPTKLALKRDELKSNMASLWAKNEVQIYKGFTVDRVKSEDFLVLDDNVSEFDDYEDADALGHVIWMTCKTFRTRFGMEPRGATKYGAPRSNKDEKKADTPLEDQFVCVIEIWDRRSGVVRTIAKGMSFWVREPYAPYCVPQRWYPFYVLGFNLIEGRWRPLSDVELLMGLQDEYNTTRTNYADVREKAVPVTIVRKSGNLTEEDILAIVNRGNKETIAVSGNPTVPIGQDVMRLDGPKIDPAAYDVTMIRNDMDLVVGRSDASRANLIKPKTATEAEIMQEAMASRTAERRDTHEDLLSDMGRAGLEICLRDMTKAEIQQIAGPDAVWPETPQGVEEAFRMTSVKVRAGSSGKPNVQKEREQWGQLLPVIKETMVGVMELRANGNYDMADATVEVLRETLRRFDENLDLDAIIPPLEKDPATGQPVAQVQAAQELMQAKEQLAQLQEENAKLQEECARAQQAEMAKTMQAQAKAESMAKEDQRKAVGFAHEEQRKDEEHSRKLTLVTDKAQQDAELKEAKAAAAPAAEGAAPKPRAAPAPASDKRMEELLSTLIDVVAGLNVATKELADVAGSDRVAVYGPDGMPERVRVEKRSLN